jgi:carbonic anhydrase
MSDIPTLVERNQRFAASFSDSQLPIRPRLSTILLTCSDARVDPAHFLKLSNGDAGVVRNAGGRVTQGVLQDLAVFGFLAAGLSEGQPIRPELVIIHHTDCGMSRLTNPEAQHALAGRLGVEPAHIADLAISDPYESVRSDVRKLREHPGVPEALLISGFVYDVATGSMNTVD